MKGNGPNVIETIHILYRPKVSYQLVRSGEMETIVEEEILFKGDNRDLLEVISPTY